MGLYAMFGALPLGLFARLPGNARQRAGTLLSVLPVGWALVTLGTTLAVNTWAAAVGMVVIGFVVAFCTASATSRSSMPSPCPSRCCAASAPGQ
ncbi:hypothetical protein [Streptomyces noursei]|uniref:hypothetical protein n=1 Tax=Streptomyces noursei TaxID=1971 RepID=UPI003820F71E